MNTITPELMALWMRIATFRGWHDLHPYYKSYDREHPDNWSGLEGKNDDTGYTKDVPGWIIGEAFTLLDELDPDKWSISLTRWSLTRWSVHLMKRSTTHEWDIDGETLDLAICNTWLFVQEGRAK